MMAFRRMVAGLLWLAVCTVASNVCRQHGTTWDCSGLGLTTLPKLDQHIVSLNLANNQISHLAEGAFSLLPSLQYLDLSQNDIQHLSNTTFLGLNELRELHLTLVNCTVETSAFVRLQNLEILKLGRVQNIDNNAMIWPPKLKYLKLLIPKDFAFGDSFRTLKLETLVIGSDGTGSMDIGTLNGTRFEKLDKSSLRRLDMHNVARKSPEVDTFINFTRLETFNLGCNYNENLILPWLQALENLPSPTLKTLILDGAQNCGTTILSTWFNSSVFSNLERLSSRASGPIDNITQLYHYLPKLTSLNLAYNRLITDSTIGCFDIVTVKNNQIETLDLNGCGLQDATYNMRRLFCWDNPEPENNINFIAPPSFVTNSSTLAPSTAQPRNITVVLNPSLEYLYLRSASVNIEDPSICDFNNAKYVDFSHIELKTIKQPLLGPKLQGIDFSLCKMQDISTAAFDDLPSLKYLNLDGNFLTGTDLKRLFKSANQIEDLHLCNTDIEEMTEQAFCGLKYLRNLTLSGNRIHTLNMNLRCNPNLKLLNLSFCALTRVEPDFIQSVENLQKSSNSTFTLDITGNENIPCDCSSVSFINWLRTTSINIVNRDRLKCRIQKDTVPILEVDISHLQEECKAKQKKQENLVIGCAVTVGLLGIGAVILCIIYKWTVRWYIYRVRKHVRGLTNKIHGGQMESLPLLDEGKYHAFVSFAEEDRQWVSDILLTKLEDWGLSVCLKHRDFTDTADNVCNAIDNSRHTVLLVTPAFAKCEACYYDMEMASPRGRVIVIYKEEVPMDLMPRTLRNLIRQGNYIEYNESTHGLNLFWHKLQDLLIQENA